LTPPTFCQVQVAIPGEPDVVEEAVVVELVVLEPVVLDSVVLLVLDVLLLVLVVVGGGVNSRLSVDKFKVGFVASNVQANAMTHRVPAG